MAETDPKTPPHADLGHNGSAPKAKGGGSGIFLGVVLLAVVMVYAYQQGMLDKSISRFTGTPSKSAPAVADAGGKAPATSASPPAVITSHDDMAGIISQLEVLNSRIIRIENETSSLQSISENLANQLDRQTPEGGIVSGANQDELDRLKLEIIDLRLRLTGDSHAALAELDALNELLSEDSNLLPLVSVNRAKLVNTPRRSQIISVYQQLEKTLASARSEVQQELDALSKTQVVDAGFLSRVLSVRQDDSKQREQLAKIDAVDAALEPARTALLQNSDDYQSLLDQLREAASQLRISFSSVHSANISKLIVQLTDYGQPESRLLLDPTAAESTETAS